MIQFYSDFEAIVWCGHNAIPHKSTINNDFNPSVTQFKIGNIITFKKIAFTAELFKGVNIMSG